MKKIPIIFVGVILLAGYLFVLKHKSASTTTTVIAPIISSRFQSIRNDPRYIALISSLPKFSDYPAVVVSIPPKPKINHTSDPLGMEFWSLTESWASDSLTYEMGGHYLIGRHGTGNSDVIVIDGITGQAFGVYGGIDFETVASSSLVIFDPFFEDENNPSCFSPSGDYDQCYTGMGGNPRYAVWTGIQFRTVCEPIVRGWKLISCGDN